jgi:hypothetical protein
MAYNTRSLEGVRRITPLSSTLLRASEGYEGQAKSDIQRASAREKIFEAQRGTPNPLTRATEEAAQKALIASQQAAIQGNYDDDIVGPLRQEHFTGADNLPTFKQAAIFNKYTPEIMQQQMLGQQQQKSFLQLKEAQRKGRMAQAADALQAPVTQRLEEIMGSGTPLKQKYNDIQQSMFANPNALGSPLLATLYQSALQSVGSQLDDRQKQENMENTMRINLAYKAIEIGDSKTAQDLLSFKEGKSSTLKEYAKNLADAQKRYSATTSGSKVFSTMMSNLKGLSLAEIEEATAGLALSELDRKRVDILKIQKRREEATDASSRMAAALSRILNEYDSIAGSGSGSEDNANASFYVKQTVENDDDLQKLLKSIPADPAKGEDKTLYDLIVADNTAPKDVKMILNRALWAIDLGDPLAQLDEQAREKADRENKFASLVNN